MSRVLKVSEGDYKIKVQTAGTIILDTSPDATAPAYGEPGYDPATQGTVIITGNLDVRGERTIVNTTNMSIEDRIIVINSGDTSLNGIRLVDGNRRAGIEFNRGSVYAAAQLVFDETVSHYDPLVDDTVPGTFVLRTVDNSYSGIQLASIGAPPGLDFAIDFGNYDQVLKLVNVPALNYSQLLDPTLPAVPDTPEDNFIPNKKYVSSYVSATGGSANVDNFHYLSNPNYTRGQAYNTYIKFTVANNERTRISTDGLHVDRINLFGDTVNNDTNNLVLSATTTNIVEVNAIFQMNDTGLTPTVAAGATKLYTVDPDTTPDPGKTGIYFTNGGNTDELVAKNRALLFSILF